MIIGIYLALVLLAYLIPFTLLSRIPRVWGSFLFWVTFAFVALLLLIKIMNQWKHEH
ncbi:MAG: hypothetical protein N2Z84_01670 [Atribacterota bacterium]|nr:hypothetical protein [Atribacterota bacterium]